MPPLLSRRFLLFLAAAIVAACATPSPSDARHARAQVETLRIVTAQGKAVRFKVEVVADDASRERGLMFRKSLAPDAGMLFDFITPRPVTFWMKNTYIPLDMLFIAPDGRILNIAAQATPLNETPIPSAGPVRGVLEIGGGRAEALGIEPGDRVEHRIFSGG